MDQKYEIIKDKPIKKEECSVYQIRALKDFSNVKKNELGGWIQSEKNLSQEGLCWIYRGCHVDGDAEIHDDATVSDNSWVSDHAKVRDAARIFEGAWVSDNAMVRGKAKVFGYSRIHDDVIIQDHAEISGDAFIHGKVLVCKNVKVGWNARLFGDVTIKKSSDFACFGPCGALESYVTYIKKQKLVSFEYVLMTLDQFEEGLLQYNVGSESQRQLLDILLKIKKI